MQGSGGAAILLLVLLLQSAAPNSAQSSTADVTAANVMANEQQPGDGPGVDISPQPDGSPEPAPTDDAMADAPSSTSAGEVCNVTTLTFPDALFNGRSTAPVPRGYGGLAWSPGSNMDLEGSNGVVRAVNTTSNFTLKSLWALVKDNELDAATINNPFLGRELVPDISYTIKIVAHKAGGQTLAFNCNVKVVTSYSIATTDAAFGTISSIGFGPSLGLGGEFFNAGPQVPGTRCPVPADMDFSKVNALDFIQVNEATIKSTGRGVIADRVTAPAPGSVSDPPPKPGQVAMYALQYQLDPPCDAP